MTVSFISARIVLAALGLTLLPMLPGAQFETASAQPGPAPIQVHADKILTALETAPWIAITDPKAKPNGRVLYYISFRTCPNCLAFKEAEFPALLAAGVEIRVIVYARRDLGREIRSNPVERALAAELWLKKDRPLLETWWAADDLPGYYAQMAPRIESAEAVPARRAAVAAGRDLISRLTGLYIDNGLELAIPVLLWKENGALKTMTGYETSAFALVRAVLTAP